MKLHDQRERTHGAAADEARAAAGERPRLEDGSVVGVESEAATAFHNAKSGRRRVRVRVGVRVRVEVRVRVRIRVRVGVSLHTRPILTRTQALPGARARVRVKVTPARPIHTRSPAQRGAPSPLFLARSP